jgi:hypothetical protein
MFKDLNRKKVNNPAYKMLFVENKNLKIEPFLAFKGDISEFSLFVILKALKMNLTDAM